MVKTYQISDQGKYGTSLKLAPMTTEDQLNVETCFKVDGTIEDKIQAQAILPDLTGFQVFIAISYDCFLPIIFCKFTNQILLLLYTRTRAHTHTLIYFIKWILNYTFFFYYSVLEKNGLMGLIVKNGTMRLS